MISCMRNLRRLMMSKYVYISYSTEVKMMELIDDLGWEYDRMSSSGKETYDKLTKLLKEDTDE